MQDWCQAMLDDDTDYDLVGVIGLRKVTNVNIFLVLKGGLDSKIYYILQCRASKGAIRTAGPAEFSHQFSKTDYIYNSNLHT